MDIDLFSEIAHPYRCTSLSFSPETLLNVTPNILSFCAAGSDFILRLFTSDLMNNNVCKVSTIKFIKFNASQTLANNKFHNV